MIRTICLAFLLVPRLLALDITRHDITWTIDDATVADYGTVENGRAFANGDPWVVPAGSSITITAISPPSTIDGDGRTINGTMVNPSPSRTQGYDSWATGAFSAANNAGRPGGATLSAGNPLVVSVGATGASIVSARSRYVAGDTSPRPALEDQAILTVLPAAPPAGAFRPAYNASNKTVLFASSQINYDVFADLPVVSGATARASVEAMWARFPYEHSGSYTDEFIRQETPDGMQYGGDIAEQVANAVVWINSDLADSQKQTLVIAIVQYGLDIWGSALAGTVWTNNGGHALGRKLPMMIAARALGSGTIMARADAVAYRIHQEDMQTFYVSSSDVARSTGGAVRTPASVTASGTSADPTITVAYSSAHGYAASRVLRISGASPSAFNGYWSIQSVANSTTVVLTATTLLTGSASGASTEYFTNWSPDDRNPIQPYTADLIGTPEWGITHHTDPANDNYEWTTAYRRINGSPMLVHATVARIMGMQDEWNNPAFFDYHRTRFWETDKDYTGANRITPWHRTWLSAYIDTPAIDGAVGPRRSPGRGAVILRR